MKNWQKNVIILGIWIARQYTVYLLWQAKSISMLSKNVGMSNIIGSDKNINKLNILKKVQMN